MGSGVGKLKSLVGDIRSRAGPELELTNPTWGTLHHPRWVPVGKTKIPDGKTKIPGGGHRIPGGSLVGKLKLLHEIVDVIP